MGFDAVPNGVVDAWRLWRHCLCRFGCYPLLVAPLVRCACILDLFSSFGCDYIRVDIGFTPVNDVWQDSRAQLGLFSFDSNQMDMNKWKRSLFNSCQPYSNEFTANFIKADKSWQIARVLANVSGIASAVACATVWLLTVTPLPASFFWPGVLLPAVVLAMATGAAKFIFFDAMICSEDLWYIDETTPPVPPLSCDIGESAVYNISSSVAYFICTILICFRAPRKRKLDENFGKSHEEKNNCQNTNNTGPSGTDTECVDVETTCSKTYPQRGALNELSVSGVSGSTTRANNTLRTPEVVASHHNRNTSDVTWETQGHLGVLSPIYVQQTLKPTAKHQNSDEDSEAQSIVIAIDDTHSRSRSEGSSGGPSHRFSTISNSTKLPPRHEVNTHSRQKSSGSDPGSIPSRISKLSFADTRADTHLTDPSQQSTPFSSLKGTPLVVAIPNKKLSINKSSANRLSSQKQDERRDDSPLCDLKVQKREKFECLPPLKEDTPKSPNDDHGDLITKCLQDLELSFTGPADAKSGYGTM